tara:strand:- start:1483 stop:1647 length:165 start_codon:yes stop_codon:yes gene_type:complete
MKSKQVKVEGITYKVSANTDRGIKDAVSMLKKSLKPKKTKPNNGEEQTGESEPV